MDNEELKNESVTPETPEEQEKSAETVAVTEETAIEEASVEESATEEAPTEEILAEDAAAAAVLTEAAAGEESVTQEAPEEKRKKGIAVFWAAHKKVLNTLLAVILVVCAVVGAYEYWYYLQPKFQDVTIELGTESISVAAFMTEYAKAERVSVVSDLSEVDITVIGDTELIFAHGQKEETVTLHVIDTVAPEVEFLTELTQGLDYEPNAADFVVSITDYSDTTVTFATELGVQETYEDVTVTVVVTDAGGNSVRQDCTLSYSWIVDSYTLELGETVTKQDLLLLDTDEALELISQDALDVINTSGVGEYTVVSASGRKIFLCTVTVVDTVAPELELQEVHIYYNAVATLDDFVVSATDASGEVTLSLLTELANGEVGEYTVTIEATDESGNVTVAETVLEIMADTEGPVISGLDSITKYVGDSAPSYLSGVTATDEVDGTVTVSYDASSVNMNKSGTYYVTYTATDSSGNTTTVKRKIVVTDDDVAPTISGLTTLTLEKHSSAPNYLSGVTATDNIDGTISVSYDASSVNYDKAGTYYVTYKATDSSGNTTTSKRTVVINHDSEDTAALVASIANSLSDDPETIRDYVRTISYSSNWGGDDPVWYGFTNKTGNCYVHALCLKAIFDYKGIECQLIWVKAEYNPHYWLIVKIDGNWKHIDATPTYWHSMYSLMNDKQRLATLSGRTWDTSLWPACN